MGTPEVLVKPSNGAIDNIPVVRWSCEHMAFVGIKHQLRGHPRRLQRMPEFVRLWRRTFAVAIADNQQGGCFNVLYEGDR